MTRRLLALLFVAACPAVASALPGDKLFSVVPTAPVSNQDFGDAVAISGNIVLVGAEDTADGLIGSAGAAYLFDGVTGAQIRKLTPAEAPATRAFGTSVAIDGLKLAIGAEDENNSKGAAYLFHANGTQLHKLTAADGVMGDEYGQDVAISGNVAAVSSPGAGALGAVYLYNVTTGAQIGGTIRPADLSPNAEFGTTIDMDGNRVIASVDNFGLGGAAYIYDTAGVLQHKLTLPSQFSTVRGFGRSVAISGNVALVGSTPSSDQTLGDHGTAFLFDATTGAFLRRLTPNDSLADDLFGEGVAISGNVAIVAARREDALGLASTAYLFDVGTGVQLARLDGTDIPAGDEAFEGVDIDGGRAIGGQEGFDSPGFANNGRANIFDALAGDYDHNGKVDGGDFLVWQRGLGSANLAADGDRDNDVDDVDLRIWQGNYGLAAPSTSPMIAAAIPEPASLSFTTVAAIVLVNVRRRKAPVAVQAL